MGARLVLHVGTMKTGTSYLQGRLFENQAELAGRGVLVPGHRWNVQVHAARDLAHGDLAGWGALMDDVRAHAGTAAISTERLGPMRRPLIRRVLDTLDDIDLMVVVTARDLNRSIPALWQETLQNGRTWHYADYLEGIEAWRPGHRDDAVGRPEAGRAFWRQMDLLRIVRNWQALVGPERLTLLTLPQPGAPRDLLWERFSRVLGVEPGGLRESNRPNASLGAASAMAVRRLNELLEADGLAWPAGSTVRKQVLGKRILAARRPDEPSIGLTTPDWVREQTTRIRHGLERLDTTVIGSLDELEPVDVPGIAPGEIDDAAVTEAALSGLAGLLGHTIGDRQSGLDADPDDEGDEGDDSDVGSDDADDD